MAALASYSTLPASSYTGLGSQGDLLHSANYGNYDAGIGSISSHPYQYEPQHSSYANDYLQSTYSNDAHTNQPSQYHPSDRYAAESTYHQEGFSNDLTHSQSQKFQDRSTVPNPYEKAYASTNSIPQGLHPAAQDTYQQGPHRDLPHPPRPASGHNQQHPSKHPGKSNAVRSEHSLNQQPPLPAIGQRPPSGAEHGHGSGGTGKPRDPPVDLKTNKSTAMRAAAIKQKEETLEQKRRDTYFPSNGKKPTPTKTTASNPPRSEEHHDAGKARRNKKQSHSVPKQSRSRRMNYLTDESNSSSDADDDRTRSKSKKRPAPRHDAHEKHAALPPLRRPRPPPFYDPLYDYPQPAILPPGHPLRRQPMHYDDYPPYGGAYPYPMRYNYRARPMYEDPYIPPPYLPPYQDSYDGFFDYEKRKSKMKGKSRTDKKQTHASREDHGVMTGNETERDEPSRAQPVKKTKAKPRAGKKDTHTDQDDHRVVTSNETERDEPRKAQPVKQIKAKTKKPIVKEEKPESEEQSSPRESENHPEPPHFVENAALEVWRQERNDYLKKKFKPTVHDVLYSQQRTKADSYLENQRRRAVRDSQGYYFPYKQYTLKDYKDLQKTEANSNPYAPLHDPILERKERTKKREDYGLHRERPAAGGHPRAAGAVPATRPWHSNNLDSHDHEKSSKRERALEYAKVQVMRNQPLKEGKNRPDPTEQYVNSLFPANDDDERQGSFNGRHRKTHSQSADEDEDGDGYDDDNE